MIGETLDGKYEILDLLGRGGMGAVYQARVVGTDRRVAVKVVHQHLGSGADGVRRFRREARAASAVDSEHIVAVLDASTHHGRGPLYIVMECLAGEDLARVLDRLGPLPPEVALRIGVQALQGLERAHAAGIVHRDIKPANLFLGRRDGGRIVTKLLDFGIAKITAGVEDPFITSLTEGGLLGSPRFMSPEQARSSRSIDHRSDLWSLGASLYCALTGHAPHHRVPSIGQLVLVLCSEPPPRLEEVAPWVPAGVARAVHRALAIHPDDRYPNAQAMLDALRALLPGGSDLCEEMLVPLPPEVRALAVEPPPPLSMRARVLASGRADDATLPLGPSDDAPVPSTTEKGHAVGPRPVSVAPLDRPRQGALLAAGAALLAGVLGAGAYRALSAQPAPSPARHVRLVVMPADVSVEVDGTAAGVRDGIVEIAGALGSEHRVRLFKGSNETGAEVLVTEEGAEPPKLELLAKPDAVPPPAPHGAR